MSKPKFNILSSKDLEKIHSASLHILEKTGVTIDSGTVIELLENAQFRRGSRDQVKKSGSYYGPFL